MLFGIRIFLTANNRHRRITFWKNAAASTCSVPFSISDTGESAPGFDSGIVLAVCWNCHKLMMQLIIFDQAHGWTNCDIFTGYITYSTPRRINAPSTALFALSG